MTEIKEGRTIFEHDKSSSSKLANKQENETIDNDNNEHDFMQEMQMEVSSHVELMMMDSDSDEDVFEIDIKLHQNRNKESQCHVNLAAGWDESAIIRCFDIAMQTHDSKNINEDCFLPITSNLNNSQPNMNSTIESSLDPPSRWRPGNLPLPQWAVDPWYAVQKGTYSKSIYKSNEEKWKEQSNLCNIQKIEKSEEMKHTRKRDIQNLVRNENKIMKNERTSL